METQAETFGDAGVGSLIVRCHGAESSPAAAGAWVSAAKLLSRRRQAPLAAATCSQCV